MKKYIDRILVSLATVSILLIGIRSILPILINKAYYDNEYLIEGIIKILFLFCTIFILKREKLIYWQYTHKSQKITLIILVFCLYFSLRHLHNYSPKNNIIINTDHLNYLFNCLATGFFEEFFFRILIFTYVYKSITPSKNEYFKTILWTSFLFGAVHIINLIIGKTDIMSAINQMISAFLIGIIFQSLLFRFNNIYLISILHTTINYNGMMRAKLFKISNNSVDVLSCEGLLHTFLFAIFICVFVVIPIAYFSLQNRYNVLIKE